MTSLTFPFTETQVRAPKVGDEVSISGIVFTGRDAVRRRPHAIGGAGRVLADGFPGRGAHFAL